MDNFGRDARSIMNSLGSIKDPHDDDDPDPPSAPMAAALSKQVGNN